MKPAPFEYVRPRVARGGGRAALAEDGDDAKVLAGGQSLVPALNMRLLRPSVLVDVNRVAGSTTSRARTDAPGRRDRPPGRPAAARRIPLLAECLPHVGHSVTRNRGTVGGSVAHADAAAELPLALTACGGSASTSTPGRRTIPAEEFFVTHLHDRARARRAARRDDLAGRSAGAGFAFEEFAQRHGDFALCMAAAASRGGRARVALGSVAPTTRPCSRSIPSGPGESAAAQVEPWGSCTHRPTTSATSSRVLVDRGSRSAEAARDRRRVTVNGRRYHEEVEPRLLLSDFLRHTLGLTGTHVGCEHGVCGACTVQLDGVAVRSCLLLAVQVDGAEILTVEGLAAGAPAAGGVPPTPRAPVRLLHARDPARRRRPARARRRRRARRSSTCSRATSAAARATTPIVDAIAQVGGAREPRAQSLLAAAERHPEREALSRRALLRRAARARGAHRRRSRALDAAANDSPPSSRTGSRPSLLYWAAQWLGAVFVPLSWRLSEDDLDYCIEDCGARVVIREDDAAARRADEHPGALDLDEHEPSLMLYTSGTTGRPKGVPRSHRADRAAGLSRRSSTATAPATARSG